MIINITAAQLLPGDVVIGEDGARDYAAFDVAHGGRIEGIAVTRVWTAVDDQDNGRPREINLTPDVELTVERRDGGPVTTVIEVGNMDDADAVAGLVADRDDAIDRGDLDEAHELQNELEALRLDIARR